MIESRRDDWNCQDLRAAHCHASLRNCCWLPAFSATVRLSEYQKQEWQVEDGLPQSELRAITQVPGGRLLIATYGGVASFDGLRFSPIRVDAKDPAASEPVNSLLLSR